MIIKWETGWTIKGELIRRVECTRETEKCVWVQERIGKERRRDKVSTYERLHDSWEEAKAYLVDKATRDEADLEDRLHRTREQISMLCGMEKPEAAE